MAEPTEDDPPCSGSSVGAEAPVPLLHYAFDGDARNSGSLGSDYDGIADSVSYEVGKLGDAVAVGFPSWVELPKTSALLQKADALTIAMWIHPTFSGLTVPFIDCRSFYDGFHTYHGVYDDRRLYTCFGTGHPANGPGGCESFDLPAGDWHYLVYLYSGRGASAEMYVDSQLVATLDAGPDFEIFGASVQDIWLGNAHVGDFRDGMGAHVIDDLRVYGQVLEQDEQCEWLMGGSFCDGSCVLR